MANKKCRRKKTGSPVRQIRASQRNANKRKMLEFVKAAHLEEAYALIPKEEIDLLLMVGFRPINVLPREGEHIPNRYVLAVKKIVHTWTRKLKLEIADGSWVSLYDYYQAGEMLTYRIRSEGYDFKNKDKVVCAAAPYLAKVKNGLLPDDHMGMLAQYLSESISSADFGFILLDKGTYSTKGLLAFVYDCFYLKIVDRQELKVSINNKVRTVYRLGLPLRENKILWIQLSPEKLGFTCGIANLKVDVYIQKHAIMRLKERLNGIQDRVIKIVLSSSVLLFKTVKNSRGQNLLQFNFEDKKLGYLVYQYVEGIVVITTFLLLTNNGTPEGERLHELLGVEKRDKQYLGIDKIEAFINSDLKDDRRSVELFTKAGCGDLFKLPAKILNDEKYNAHVVDLFKKYLELDNEIDAELLGGEQTDFCIN